MRGLLVGTLAVTAALLVAPTASAADPPATGSAVAGSAVAGSAVAGSAVSSAETPLSPAPPVAAPTAPTAPTAPRATPATGGAGNHYVALGDSWAAGSVAGALDPASDACRRSANAYPPRVAGQAAETFWVSRACASSTRGGNGQFDVLDRNTRAVSATVGSDATGLGTLVRSCSRVGTSTTCDAAAARFDRALAALPRALNSSLVDMRRRAPAAAITVTGFPLLAQGTTCATGAADLARARRLDDAVTRLNRVLAERTAAAKVRFVDVRPAFAGHSVCTPDLWIAPFTGADALLAGSATATGHARGFVPALTTAIREETAAAATAAPTPGPSTPAPDPVTTSAPLRTPGPASPAPASPAPASPAPAPADRSSGDLAAPLFAG